MARSIIVSSILDNIVAFKLSEIAAAKSLRSGSSLHRQIDLQPPAQDFLAALRKPTPVSLIAEVKKASPSKGVIRAEFDAVAIAKTYSENGASCISVLTDEHFFQGRLEYLRAIRAAVDIPLLRKDFILDEYQIIEARAAGADAVLLIAECLEPLQLLDLHQVICELGMTPLVELYDERNLAAVLACQPQLVGINNRDLNTFNVDLHHTLRIKRQLPPQVMVVSESGIETAEDVRLLREHRIDAMLVGESLMRADDIGAAVRNLLAR